MRCSVCFLNLLVKMIDFRKKNISELLPADWLRLHLLQRNRVIRDNPLKLIRFIVIIFNERALD